MRRYNTRDLAHAWVYNESESGKCASSFYFEGDTIYSYGSHFPICKKMTVKGQLYYFWNDRTYSNSTSRHQRYVKRAIPDYGNIINVIAMPDNWPETHKKNIEYFANWLVLAKELENKARSRKQEYHAHAQKAVFELQRYCDLFDIPVPESLIDPDTFDVEKYYADMAERERKEKQAQARKNKAKAKKEIVNFRNGQRFSNYYFPFDLLRLTDGMVETSQGVRVDIRPVKILWCMLQSGKDILGRHCGKFEIKEVTNKVIRVGCHIFERKEVLNLINQME
jgi:hypothetical protein